MTRRIPPHAADAEASVLGAILLRNDALRACAPLAPEDFYDPKHQIVFAAMRALGDAARPIDPVTMEAELRRVGKLASVGGLAFLAELVSAVPTADNVRHYVYLVRDAATARRMILTASEIAAKGFSEYGDVEDYLVEAERAVLAVTRKADARLVPASAAEQLASEAEERRALAARLLPYDVKFLDDALDGILPNHLVLLVARTGAGKTALASLVAEANAARGKRVVYIALEAEPKEIERRIKYRHLVQYLERSIADANERANVLGRATYRAWYLGRLDPYIPPEVAAAADRAVAKRLATLKTFYRGAHFTARDLARLLRAIDGECDLVVLDHLHYVDLDEDAFSENAAQKRIIMTIRDLAGAMAIPVLVVAHIRKRDRRQPQLVPELDDVHGSSDIVKNATHAIFLSPAYEQPTGAPYLWSTYMTVAKDRMEGAAPYVALLTYNARRGRYEDAYTLGRIVGDSWQAVPAHELPRWARQVA